MLLLYSTLKSNAELILLKQNDLKPIANEPKKPLRPKETKMYISTDMTTTNTAIVLLSDTSYHSSPSFLNIQ